MTAWAASMQLVAALRCGDMLRGQHGLLVLATACTVYCLRLHRCWVRYVACFGAAGCQALRSRVYVDGRSDSQLPGGSVAQHRLPAADKHGAYCSMRSRCCQPQWCGKV